MNKDKVIFKKDGRTKKSIITKSLILALALGVVIYLLIDDVFWAVCIFSLTLSFGCVFSGPYRTITLFDGWIIKEDSISIAREHLFLSKSIVLMFTDIKKIEYSEGGYRSPSVIRIKTNDKKYQLYIDYNIFMFADTLKFIKQKGIPISFDQRDAEIELYLSDKIRKIPMTNE